MSTIRLIAGSGRSGTTWIQDALAAANRLRTIFEPLHPYVSRIGDKYAHRALAADDEHSDLASFWKDVCGGGGPRLWTQYRQQWRWLFPPVSQFSTRKGVGRVWRHWAKFLAEMPRMSRIDMRQDPLVKCIRANLMLPWLVRQLDCRVVLVVRHPGAVVESELRSGWNANFALTRFRNDSRLHELTNCRYLKLLTRSLSPVEALTARWIIENQWVVEQAIATGIAVFNYEQLRSSQPGAWRRLCDSLDLALLPDSALLLKPSQQSGAKRSLIPLEQSVSPQWMARLTTQQSCEIQGILDEVAFDTYRMDVPSPLHLSCGSELKTAAMDGA